MTSGDRLCQWFMFHVATRSVAMRSIYQYFVGGSNPNLSPLGRTLRFMEFVKADRAVLFDLIGSVVQQAPLADSYHHGERHWIRVAWTGRRLIDDGTAADPLVVLLFSLFHDSRRENEYRDADHGVRGGALAAEVLPDLDLVRPEQLQTIVTACEGHTEVRYSDDPTIGTCWDADRLNLWRVGKIPDAYFLSTDAARSPARIGWTRNLHDEVGLDWAEVLEAYGL